MSIERMDGDMLPFGNHCSIGKIKQTPWAPSAPLLYMISQ